MILAAVVLILSAGTLFFYFQAVCQKILRRQFEQEYFQSVANAVLLEFPSLRKSLDDSGVAADYSGVLRELKCDFLALTYLLKSVGKANEGYSMEEWLLIQYFRWQLFSLAIRRLLKVGEMKSILRLTSVLQYFANVVGQRVNAVGSGKFTAAAHLMDL